MPAFSLSFLYLIEMFFISSSFSPIRVVSSTYLRLLALLLAVLIPACNSSRLAIHMTCSAYKLHKHITKCLCLKCLPNFVRLSFQEHSLERHISFHQSLLKSLLSTKFLRTPQNMYLVVEPCTSLLTQQAQVSVCPNSNVNFIAA